MNKKPMECAPSPCGSCPYRRDTPPGVWDSSEYEKLRGYTLASGEGVPAVSIFLCHQTNATGRETVCRGWLTVEQDSIAVRLAVIRSEVTPQMVNAPVEVPLYRTGAEAAAAGLAGVPRPTPEAARMMEKLRRKGAAR